MDYIEEKIAEFKRKIFPVIEKRKEAEEAYHKAFNEHVKYVDKSINLDFRIGQLGFFQRREKERLLEEKRLNDIKKAEADKVRIKTCAEFKKYDNQFKELKEEFYSFCRMHGIDTPEDEQQEEE